MNAELQGRLDALIERLRTTYDGIGHSSGRPYVYFIYHPSLESEMRRAVAEQLRSDERLTFHHIDLLRLTVESLIGQEEQRQLLLNNAKKPDSASGIMRLWTRRILATINTRLAQTRDGERPVIVLEGLAALHPLGTPTALMEYLSEQESRNPRTDMVVPIVVCVPGTRPPQSSHLYHFLGQERLRLGFYRGEEM